MCRYGTNRYKPHYACFACRKSFKRRLKADVDPHGEEKPARCPQCGGEMADMGLDFAPPPMKDARAWRVVASLWSLDFTWHSCGCGGPGYRPRNPREHREFLARRRAQYAARQQEWSQRPAGDPQRSAAIRHWSERLAAIDAAIREAARSPATVSS